VMISTLDRCEGSSGIPFAYRVVPPSASGENIRRILLSRFAEHY
jgi:hypothetical protein